MLCNVFEHLYSTSPSIMPYRSALYCDLLLENRQVLRSAREVDKLEERKVVLLEASGRRFHTEEYPF